MILETYDLINDPAYSGVTEGAETDWVLIIGLSVGGFCLCCCFCAGISYIYIKHLMCFSQNGKDIDVKNIEIVEETGTTTEGGAAIPTKTTEMTEK